MIRLPVRAMLAAAAVLCASAVRAENPKVSLPLKPMSCWEAAGALSRAAKIPVYLFSERNAIGARPPKVPPGMEEPAEFDWRGIRFTKALRQLCERYDLRPSRQEGAFVLYRPLGGIESKPPPVLALAEKNGARVWLSQVRALESTGMTGQPETSLDLTFQVEWEDGDPLNIYSIDGLRVRDDLGHDLTHAHHWGMGWGPYLDLRRFVIGLSGLDPQARHITSIDGDLLVQRVHREHRLEVPIDKVATRREAEGAVAQVWSAQPYGLKYGNSAESGIVVLPIRLSMPEQFDRGPQFGRRDRPSYQVLDEKGNGLDSRDLLPTTTDGTTTCESSVVVKVGKATTSKVVFRWTEQTKPEKLFSFKLGSVPIPPIERASKAEPKKMVQ